MTVEQATTERSIRFEERTPLGSFQVGQWIAPLSPAVAAKVPKKLSAAHQEVARRMEATRSRIAELEAERETAEASDDQAALDAVAAGKDVPDRRAPAVEAELEQMRRIEAALGQTLVDSANEMLTSVAGELEDVSRELRAAEGELYTGLGELLDSFAARCEAIGQLSTEITWVAQFRRDRNPFGRPWTGRRAAMPRNLDILFAQLRDAVTRVVHERERRAAAEQ